MLLSERAVRIDDNIVKLKFKAEDVGQTFYLKFTSYNTFGRAEQQVANVTAYSFTLVGSMAAMTSSPPSWCMMPWFSGLSDRRGHAAGADRNALHHRRRRHVGI
jgi:hypothetical protein